MNKGKEGVVRFLEWKCRHLRSQSIDGLTLEELILEETTVQKTLQKVDNLIICFTMESSEVCNVLRKNR